ncbi:Lipase [Grifola frondosa]|uniref:Lipase n=1 Tax=Grifola frondosa TaxID=5627 RepID=A0A1C7MLG1_GRIFR|nr:Lipase [Grifola frondosa]
MLPGPSFAAIVLTALGAVRAVTLPLAPLSQRENTLIRRGAYRRLPRPHSRPSHRTLSSRAAYCASNKLVNWGCGDACDAVPGFQLEMAGGDGNLVQLYYVGYWPEQNAAVVAHEGTDPTQLMSDLTDVDILTKNLNTSLFPATKKIIQDNNADTVILVGHSLGGALAQLDALFMTLNLPSSIHVKAVTYGTPRVGNSAYAAWYDAMVPDFTRINNEKDPIPIVPGRFLGFEHPHGEVHIVAPGDAVSCPGDDDSTDAACTIATVPNIADGDILNHLGPYQGIHIGTIYCT